MIFPIRGLLCNLWYFDSYTPGRPSRLLLRRTKFKIYLRKCIYFQTLIFFQVRTLHNAYDSQPVKRKRYICAFEIFKFNTWDEDLISQPTYSFMFILYSRALKSSEIGSSKMSVEYCGWKISCLEFRLTLHSNSEKTVLKFMYKFLWNLYFY